MISIKNRGMFLETILNHTNQKYVEQNQCVVNKIPTNFKITTNSQGQKFRFDQNQNCDYIGCYQGTYFEFEAKQTDQQSFNFKNIRPNQMLKLDQVIENHGIGFLIIYFTQTDQYFFVEWIKIKTHVLANKKTIPLEWFVQNCEQLYINSQITLDYLKAINHLISYT